MNKKINLERLLIVAAIVLGLVSIVYMFSGKRNQVTENPNTVSDSLRMELVKAKLAAQEAEAKTRQTNVTPPLTEEERKVKLRKELLKMEVEHPLE